MTKNDYSPDTVSPPGDTILDMISEKNILPLSLPLQLGLNWRQFQKLLEGKKKITPKLAIKLSEVIGSTPIFWMTREAQYRLNLTKLKDKNKT